MEVLISIIPLHGDDPIFPLRCQFLVIGTFAMIINNKPQGKSFNPIGAYFETQVFTHEQLHQVLVYELGLSVCVFQFPRRKRITIPRCRYVFILKYWAFLTTMVVDNLKCDH